MTILLFKLESRISNLNNNRINNHKLLEKYNKGRNQRFKNLAILKMTTKDTMGALTYKGKDRICHPCESICSFASSAFLIILPSLGCLVFTVMEIGPLPVVILVFLFYTLSLVNSVRLLVKVAFTDPGIIPRV